MANLEAQIQKLVAEETKDIEDPITESVVKMFQTSKTFAHMSTNALLPAMMVNPAGFMIVADQIVISLKFIFALAYRCGYAQAQTEQLDAMFQVDSGEKTS